MPHGVTPPYIMGKHVTLDTKVVCIHETQLSGSVRIHVITPDQIVHKKPVFPYALATMYTIIIACLIGSTIAAQFNREIFLKLYTQPPLLYFITATTVAFLSYILIFKYFTHDK